MSSRALTLSSLGSSSTSSKIASRMLQIFYLLLRDSASRLKCLQAATLKEGSGFFTTSQYKLSRRSYELWNIFMCLEIKRTPIETEVNIFGLSSSWTVSTKSFSLLLTTFSMISSDFIEISLSSVWQNLIYNGNRKTSNSEPSATESKLDSSSNKIRTIAGS